MAYPPLPTTSYLHPNTTSNHHQHQNQNHHHHSRSFSSGSPSSNGPITPELPSNPIAASDYLSLQPTHDSGKNTRRGSQDEPDLIPCQWKGCSHSANGPDALYDHLCNAHVGRKSTNNLNLTCGWEGCGVKCVKRDHITSHLRVHTPLKPHPCAVCSKTFKRPQDLKKHERIHTTEHHQMHKLSKATTSHDPTFNERVAAQPPNSDDRRQSGGMNRLPSPMSDSLSPSSSSGLQPSSPYDALQHSIRHPAHKSVSPTPSALAALHKKQHEELAAYQQREMMVLQQLAFQQQQSQAYAAQLASEGLGGVKMGQKRDIEDGDGFGAFLADMKKRKVEPVYDNEMISRLNSLVPPALPSTLPTFSSLPENGYQYDDSYTNQGFNSYLSMPNAPTHPPSSNSLPIPEIRTEADLAMFNQFMISLGRDAAMSSHSNGIQPMIHSTSFGSIASDSTSSNSPLSDPSPIEDLFNPEELASLGLSGMPGIPVDGLKGPSISHDHMAQPLPSGQSYGGLYPSLETLHSRSRHGSLSDPQDISKRAIAGLPRSTSIPNSTPSLPPKPEYLSNFYGLGPTPYASLSHLDSSSSTLYGHNSFGSNGLHNYSSFDSLARSKSNVPAATLAQKDFYKKTYRHVAPLGAAMSSRFRKSAERTGSEDDHEAELEEPSGMYDDEVEEQLTPKISVRSLLLSDDQADPRLKLPAINATHDEPLSLPSLNEQLDLDDLRVGSSSSSTRPTTPSRNYIPVKRHTEDDIVRGVKRLEVSPSTMSIMEVGVEMEMNEQTRTRRRHAAIIRAWLVALNLQWRRKNFERHFTRDIEDGGEGEEEEEEESGRRTPRLADIEVS